MVHENSFDEFEVIAVEEEPSMGRVVIAKIEDQKEFFANAKLIAAAPDMLEALEWLMDGDMTMEQVNAKARIAIRKATE